MSNPPHRPRWPRLLLTLPLAALSCDGGAHDVLDPLAHPAQVIAASAVQVNEFEVPPPPFKDASIFPCSDCHDPDIPINKNRRELKFAHEEVVLSHDEDNRWCLDCHDTENRDMLRLASGTLVSFEESYKLCGQCHGDKYRDWRAGIHGRRTGSWDGDKSYLLCVHCHDSHQPQFQPIEPLPAPQKPTRTR